MDPTDPRRIACENQKNKLNIFKNKQKIIDGRRTIISSFVKDCLFKYDTNGIYLNKHLDTLYSESAENLDLSELDAVLNILCSVDHFINTEKEKKNRFKYTKFNKYKK